MHSVGISVVAVKVVKEAALGRKRERKKERKKERKEDRNKERSQERKTRGYDVPLFCLFWPGREKAEVCNSIRGKVAKEVRRGGIIPTERV